MAILTRTALDALWINGFIPDEDDYIDRADTLIALASGGSGATEETLTLTPSVIDNGGGATYSASIASCKIHRTGNIISGDIGITGINTSGTPTGQLLVTLPSLSFQIQGSNAVVFRNIQGFGTDFYGVYGSLSAAGVDFVLHTSFSGGFNNNTALQAETITNGTIALSFTARVNVSASS